MLPTLIPALAPVVSRIVGNLFPDPEQRAKAEQEMMSSLLAHSREIENAAAGVIKAEANSKWALAAVWRPVLMLVFVAIIANNYILAPYVGLIFDADLILEVPADLWALIKLGVGGYIAGRSGEKMIEKFKEK